MTAQEAEARLEELFQQWSDDFFKKNPRLLGVFQFGSSTKSPLKRQTDLDLLLIFDHLPKNPMDQFRLIEPLEDNLNKDLKTLEGFEIHSSLILKSKDRLDRLSSFYLDFLEAGKIRWDPAHLLNKLLMDIRNWITENGAYKVQKGQLWYWVYSGDPHRKTPVSFQFTKK